MKKKFGYLFDKGDDLVAEAIASDMNRVYRQVTVSRSRVSRCHTPITFRNF